MQERLDNLRLLVVEDEYFLAEDMARALEACGAEVVGPASDQDEALRFIHVEARLDGAVIDVNLGDGAGFRVADALRLRNIPFVFATGYDRAALPPGFEDVQRWEKPYDPASLARSLPKLFGVV